MTPRFTTPDQQAWFRYRFFLTKAQRAQLTEEYIECSYEVDEFYDEADEDVDRAFLAKLDNVTFAEEVTNLMPEALLYL